MPSTTSSAQDAHSGRMERGRATYPTTSSTHTHGTRSRCRQRERVLTLQCCETSIFLMTLRIDAPYRVPYFPVIPTFLVRFPMVREVCV